MHGPIAATSGSLARTLNVILSFLDEMRNTIIQLCSCSLTLSYLLILDGF